MKALVKKILDKCGYRVSATRYVPRLLLEEKNLRMLSFDDVICRRIFESGPELTFVQVGAFDGLIQDPLRKYIVKCSWQGIMIEPQSHAAAKLRELYANNERIAILQAAVDEQERQRTFYTIDLQRAAPAWVGALASFSRENIIKHSVMVPGLDEMIREETVDCVTFDTVLGKLPSNKLDLLQIDAEGADAYLLSLFPFHRTMPAIVHWEVNHLSMREREDCLGRLYSFGYRFAPSGNQDMIAVQF